MWEIPAIIGLGLALYLWLTRHYDYWKNQGVPYVEPTLIFGNSKEIILQGKNTGLVYGEIYEQFQDEPAVGLFKLRQPQLLIRDMDLIKTVLIKEFNSFHDNDFHVDLKVDPILGRNPFITQGDQWKKVRSIQTQHQTSGKIKQMFSLMEEVVKDMLKFLKQNEGKAIEAKYFSGQYTTDVVASCVYGLKTDSFLDENAQFRKMTEKIIDPSSFTAFVLVSNLPILASIFKLRMLPKTVSDFFEKVVADMISYRQKNNVTRNDFLGSLLEENKTKNAGYTVEELTAHSLTFVFDGYDTSSTAMGFILYLLAIHPDVQEKLREEILNYENDENGPRKLSYETVQSLQYLDAVCNESLRMYPPAGSLTKVCSKDITLTSGNRQYAIKKGMTVAIPLHAVQNDGKYYHDPHVFDPDRFYKQPTPQQFFPFSMGPRACVGSRFAITQIKTGIVNIIKEFHIKPVQENAKLPEINEKSPLLFISKYPLLVKFVKV